jgi:hypothetical protein
LIKQMKRSLLDTHIETIALAFAITEEAIEDNLYDKLAGRYTRALARSMSNTKQVKQSAVLNRAQVTTATGGDGVPLISRRSPFSNWWYVFKRSSSSC